MSFEVSGTDSLPVLARRDGGAGRSVCGSRKSSRFTVAVSHWTRAALPPGPSRSAADCL